MIVAPPANAPAAAPPPQGATPPPREATRFSDELDRLPVQHDKMKPAARETGEKSDEATQPGQSTTDPAGDLALAVLLQEAPASPAPLSAAGRRTMVTDTLRPALPLNASAKADGPRPLDAGPTALFRSGVISRRRAARA